MPITYVERFHSGTWITVPSVTIDGVTTVVTGRWLKRAAIDAEDCIEHELPRPDDYIAKLMTHRGDGLAADIFTFAQMLPRTQPEYPYPMEQEAMAAIRLSGYANWWDGLPQEGRKNVRRAIKRGVDIVLKKVDDDIVRGIVEINNETPVRQGRHFTHYGESFDRVKTDFLAFEHRSDLFCAYADKELIGVAKIIYCGEIAALMKLQTKMSHADKRPANALLARVVERCCERGATYVTYGLYRYGNQARTSLMEFKARHGFSEMSVPRYFVPLSAKGRLACHLKLYRGTVGMLPPRVLEVGRSLRRRWIVLAGVAQR